MLPDPNCQLLFGKPAFGKAQEGEVLLLRRSFEISSIQKEEGAAHDIGGALVAIYEGVIPDETPRIGSSQRGQIRFGPRIYVGDEVLRPGQSRFEEAAVPDSLPSTMLGQLPAMDGEHHVPADPRGLLHGGYSASFRSTSRSSRITRSAASICAARSGL